MAILTDTLVPRPKGSGKFFREATVPEWKVYIYNLAQTAIEAAPGQADAIRTDRKHAIERIGKYLEYAGAIRPTSEEITEAWGNLRTSASKGRYDEFSGAVFKATEARKNTALEVIGQAIGIGPNISHARAQEGVVHSAEPEILAGQKIPAQKDLGKIEEVLSLARQHFKDALAGLPDSKVITLAENETLIREAVEKHYEYLLRLSEAERSLPAVRERALHVVHRGIPYDAAAALTGGVRDLNILPALSEKELGRRRAGNVREHQPPPSAEEKKRRRGKANERKQAREQEAEEAERRAGEARQRELKEAKELAERHRSTAEELGRQLGLEQEKIRGLEQRVTELGAAATPSAEQIAELERTRTELGNARTLAEGLQGQLDGLTEQLGTLTTQRDGLLNQNATLTEQASTAEAQRLAEQQARERAEQALEAAQQSRQEAQTALEEAQRNLSDAVAGNTMSADDRQRLEQELAARQHELEARTNELAGLRTEAAALEQRTITAEAERLAEQQARELAQQNQQAAKAALTTTQEEAARTVATVQQELEEARRQLQQELAARGTNTELAQRLQRELTARESELTQMKGAVARSYSGWGGGGVEVTARGASTVESAVRSGENAVSNGIKQGEHVLERMAPKAETFAARLQRIPVVAELGVAGLAVGGLLASTKKGGVPKFVGDKDVQIGSQALASEVGLETVPEAIGTLAV